MLFSFNDTVLAASNELSLDDCIFLALKNNQVVKIATFDRQTSLAALNQEESGKGFTVMRMKKLNSLSCLVILPKHYVIVCGF